MLIAKYLLESVCRLPEGVDGATTDPAATPPAAVVADPAAADPPPPASDAEPEPAVVPAPAEHGNKGKTPWYMTRISEESNARRVAEERARIAEEALARQPNGGAAAPAAEPARPAPQPIQQNFETAVRTEAQRLRLYEDTVAVKNAGLAAHPDFNSSLNILTAIGATEDDFVQDVLAVDRANAHEIFHKLALDPEKAAVLAGMSSRARIAELTRMTMPAAAPAADPKVDPKPPAKAPAAPAAKQVSKAPPPAPPVEPSAVKVVDWRADTSSEAEFQAGFEDMMKRRNARR